MGVVYFSIIPTFEPSRYCKCWIVCFYIRNRYLKVPDKHAAANLTAKSGISNHAAAGIRDDPCLSKFGALYGLCPQADRQF